LDETLRKNRHTMGTRRIALVSTTVILSALLAGGVIVALATRGDGQARASRPVPVQSSPCATALLKDWGDGRIDGIYPIACYRIALKSLPVDLQVYSSASDDIAQALSQRIVQSAEQRTRTGVRWPAD
jgi:hypothetical protein